MLWVNAKCDITLDARGWRWNTVRYMWPREDY